MQAGYRFADQKNSLIEWISVYIDFPIYYSSSIVALDMSPKQIRLKKEYLRQALFWLCLYSLHLAYFLQFAVFETPYMPVQLMINYLVFIFISNLFYYFLVPRVLRRKWLLFLVLTAVILITLPLIKHYLDVWLMHYFKSDRIVLYGNQLSFTAFFGMRFLVFTFWAGLAVFLRLLVEWFNAERQQLKLSNQQLQSELAYLRSQVSPHFLFNTLNNIYALAYKKSDHTAEAIMKLSSMMRYMLYEANEDRVSLAKEVEYLNSFIALQQLRTKQEAIFVFEIAGEIGNKEIAPLLLIPLVENAFKHGNFKKSPIQLQLTILANQIRFRINNHYTTQHEKDSVGGVGLQNIKRRLELLYPKKHSMEIKDQEETFKVTLTISE